MRLIYFGSGAFGLPTLRRLLQRHQVVAVVTQPDRPAGRGGRLHPTPVADLIEREHPKVPLLKPERIREQSVVDHVRSFESDAWVVIAYGQKLPANLLEGRFAMNLHASLLPRWRGAAPINAAILAGDPVTGNTVITLAERMDAGLILGQSERAIEPTHTAGELHDLLADDGPDLVEQVLNEHAHGGLRPIAQDESRVTIAGKLSREHDSFDAHQPANFLKRQIHAMTPWPGVSIAFVHSEAAKRSEALITGKVGRAAVVDEPRDGTPSAGKPFEPGRLTDPDEGVIACGQHSRLRLLEFQPVGKRMMPWADFRRGAGRTLTHESMAVSPKELEP
ncbi:MAG: methionyl-tRNA formyltransferase [Phycisphaeraceae bacterium]|nr:methionyl-tRNA formyltransferase [Phycisphaeraceae bacterium]